jgi:hypothetical protein
MAGSETLQRASRRGSAHRMSPLDHGRRLTHNWGSTRSPDFGPSRLPEMTAGKWILAAWSVLATVGGFGAYFMAGHRLYLGLIGFLGILATLVIFAFSRPAEPL